MTLAPQARQVSLGLVAGLIVSALLGRLPLLDGLTYEHAVTVALVAFAAAVALGSRAAVALAAPYRLRWKLLERTPRERVEPALVRAGATLAAFVLAAAAVPVWNGERLGCAWERGIPIYLLTTWPAIPLGLALGVFVRAAAPRSRAQRAALVALLVALLAAATVREALAGPRVVFHNLVVGIVTTSAYLGLDGEVPVAAHDLLHRAAALVLAAALLALAFVVAAARGRAGTPEDAPRVALLLRAERRRALWRTGASALLLALMALGGDPFGFGTGEKTLARELSVRHDTGHFRLRLRPGGRAERLAAVLGADCEFERRRLGRLLGLEADAPEERIEVFVYEDAAERRRLTGASGFLFAKPWRRQVHTELDPGGSLAALAHELAHVLAGRFGLPGLAVSARYGLIEGLAEGVAGGYAERSWRHEPVAAALAAGLLPRASDLVGSLGFAARDSHVSYQASASLVGFLLRQHGPARLRAVYAWGDFETAYGVSLAALDREWRSFLATVPVGARAREVAMRAYDRELSPPFFLQVCARLGLRPDGNDGNQAPCERPWECAASGRDLEEALSRLDRSAAEGPWLERDLALVRLAYGLVRLGRPEAARETAERRAELGMVAPAAARAFAAVADDGALAAILLNLGQRSGEEEGDGAELEVEGVREVLEVARELARGVPYAALAPRLGRLGGCLPGLEVLEAQVLLRGADAALRAGDRAASLRLAGAVLALAGAGADARSDALVARERALWPGSGGEENRTAGAERQGSPGVRRISISSKGVDIPEAFPYIFP